MNDLETYSNPLVAQKKAMEYLGKEAQLYRSTKADKKYMVFDPNNQVWVHFGQLGYEDFTKHQNQERRDRYLARATKMKGNWQKNPYSPNNLSINILW